MYIDKYLSRNIGLKNVFKYINWLIKYNSNWNWNYIDNEKDKINI